MKNKFKNLKSRKYLLLFILVMGLNTLLTVTLLQVSFSQTKKEDFSNQQPVKVEVMEQKDSPLRITIINVNNSPLSYQEIIISLQNVSDKPIRAYTLVGDAGKSSGKVITNSFATELLQIGLSVTNSIDLERQSIKEGETALLSIDYVEFEDGSSWGNDNQRKSKVLAGEREGRKVAVKQLKDLLKNRNISSMSDITNLLKDLEGTIVQVPEANQSDEWKRGFRLGYKSVISILQGIEGHKIEKFTKKLDEIEKIATKEVSIQ